MMSKKTRDHLQSSLFFCAIILGASFAFAQNTAGTIEAQRWNRISDLSLKADPATPAGIAAMEQMAVDLKELCTKQEDRKACAALPAVLRNHPTRKKSFLLEVRSLLKAKCEKIGYLNEQDDICGSYATTFAETDSRPQEIAIHRKRCEAGVPSGCRNLAVRLPSNQKTERQRAVKRACDLDVTECGFALIVSPNSPDAPTFVNRTEKQCLTSKRFSNGSQDCQTLAGYFWKRSQVKRALELNAVACGHLEADACFLQAAIYLEIKDIKNARLSLESLCEDRRENVGGRGETYLNQVCGSLRLGHELKTREWDFVTDIGRQAKGRAP